MTIANHTFENYLLAPVASTLRVFDKEHSQDKLALEIQQSLHAYVSGVVASLASSKSEGEAQAQAGAIVSSGEQAAAAPSSPPTLFAMRARALSLEVDELGFRQMYKRQLIAIVGQRVLDIGSKAMADERSCNLQMQAEQEKMGKVAKMTIIRKGSGSGACKLPFFGKVVDERAASMVPRANVLPLGNGGGETKIPLFVDGTAFMNPKKSDVCYAWLVPRCSKGDIAGDDDDDAADRHANKRKAKQKKKPKPEVPTHTVAYETFTVEVNEEQLEFDMPYLVDKTANALLEGRCIREYTSWDDVELAKPDAKPAATLATAAFMHK